jgi:hypothetical protein
VTQAAQSVWALTNSLGSNLFLRKGAWRSVVQPAWRGKTRGRHELSEKPSAPEG